MQVKQLITGSRRAAPRTLIAGQQKKWTLRKPLINRTRWIEEKKKDRSRGNRHPSRRRNGKLSCSISGDVNKMKIRHDLPSLVCDQAAFCFFSFFGCRVTIFRSSA